MASYTRSSKAHHAHQRLFRVSPSLTFRRQVVVAGEVSDEKLQAAKKFKSYFNTRRRNNGTIS
jgi:hypothetical protein